MTIFTLVKRPSRSSFWRDPEDKIVAYYQSKETAKLEAEKRNKKARDYLYLVKQIKVKP